MSVVVLGRFEDYSDSFKSIAIILQISSADIQINYQWKFAWIAWNRQLTLSEAVRDRRMCVARLQRNAI